MKIGLGRASLSGICLSTPDFRLITVSLLLRRKHIYYLLLFNHKIANICCSMFRPQCFDQGMQIKNLSTTLILSLHQGSRVRPRLDGGRAMFYETFTCHIISEARLICFDLLFILARRQPMCKFQCSTLHFFKPVPFSVAFFFQNVYSFNSLSENGRFGMSPKPSTAESRRFSRLSRDLRAYSLGNLLFC